MNKAKLMQKKLVTLAAMATCILLISVGAMVFTGSLATQAQTRRMEAENARNNDQAQISSMRAQIEQSGDAEKTFVKIALDHSSNDYSANTDTLKNWLRTMKDQYRFSNNFKLTLALDKPGDKPSLSAIDYDVTVREPMKLELGAISDMHVFSFVRQLERDMPGFVRITRLELERRSDIDNNALRELSSGLAPEYVGAMIEFSWVGLSPKEKDVTSENTAGSAAPTSTGPGVF